MSDAAPIIFLDVDGVLNAHDFDAGAQSCTISPECVLHFNRILRETGAKVVLSSAWRYMVHGGQMTLDGFRYMLQTHGVAGCDIIGLTVPDETCVYCHTMRDGPNLHPETKQPTCPTCGREADRAGQIMAWLLHSAGHTPPAWIAIDDLPLPGIDAHHVATVGEVGLTEAEVNLAVYLLTKEADRVPAIAR